MCRLFGYVADAPTALVDELGAEEFEAFTSLTRVHADGWGMAWHDAETGRTRSARSFERADDDPEYARLAAQRLGSAGFVHLRWATGGLAVNEHNTHPFVDGDLAFGHNGHIGPIDKLEGLLGAEQRAKLRGTTDSERYFRLIVQCIQDEGDEAAGVTTALRLLMREFPHSSLNALLLTGSKLFGIHVNSKADSPREGLRELFESPDAIPAYHETEYYAMGYRASPSCLQIISSGLSRTGWTPVPPDTAAVVDLESRTLRRLDLIPV
ncbi:hypothetical protein GCM10011490_26870 [Pseudoclavibacter endophyticus]|uniref:Class II glutamine amidotransferase n=1 Tax=Pseudoclavibacter endophyticus TaxID=1778590 RepID=A0A6H9WJP4_9MICO|nr:class II glutamine amidotransferase [Pseudoclavibacter endophyticus]KAB1646876.1 class II glutamine amidotransferase [Pseudoclavibacter endophyticus]GGA74782.1 hypothetical protein GCM10011490_26870 [Pseudoclavibacter endophyticus]